MVQEVAVVQRLQAEIIELQVALGLQCPGQLLLIEQCQFVVEQLGFDAVADELRKVLCVAPGHCRLRDLFTEHFAPHRVQEQPRGDIRIGRILLDQCACCQDGGLVDLVERNSVVQVLEGLGKNGLRGDILGQSLTRRPHQRLDARHIQRDTAPLLDHFQRRCGDRRRSLSRGGPFLSAPFAIQHIGARDIVRAVAHQRKFDLILDIFNMKGAAGRLTAQQRSDHAGRELLDLLADRGGCSTLPAMHCNESLGHCHRDLRWLEGDHGAIAADDLVVPERRRLDIGDANTGPDGR